MQTNQSEPTPPNRLLHWLLHFGGHALPPLITPGTGVRHPGAAPETIQTSEPVETIQTTLLTLLTHSFPQAL